MAGFVGESISAEKQQEGEGKQEDQVLIYTHKSFDINYNNEQVSSRSLPLLCSPWAECRSAEWQETRKAQSCTRLIVCCSGEVSLDEQYSPLSAWF
jgi:hypothetical protein